MSRAIPGTLRSLLILMDLAAIAGAVWILPEVAAEMVRQSPDVASFRVPALVGSWIIIASIIALSVTIWILLTMAQRREVFSAWGLGWVNVALAAIGVPWIVVAGLLAWSFTLPSGAPWVVLGGLGTLVGIGALWLLVAVLRSLLARAAGLQDELAEVI